MKRYLVGSGIIWATCMLVEFSMELQLTTAHANFLLAFGGVIDCSGIVSAVGNEYVCAGGRAMCYSRYQVARLDVGSPGRNFNDMVVVVVVVLLLPLDSPNTRLGTIQIIGDWR